MRALLRLGAREAWAHKLRSLLVLVLILAPVAASSAALVLVPIFTNEPERIATEQLGDAQLVLSAAGPDQPWLDDPVWQEIVLSDGVEVVDAAAFTAWVPVADTEASDLVRSVDVVQVDATNPMVSPRFVLGDGRLPSRAGEIALAPGTMRRLGVGIGDRARFAVPDIDAEVVGELRYGSCADCEGAVLGAGSVQRPLAPTVADPFPAEWWSVSWSDQRYMDGLSPAQLGDMEAVVSRLSDTENPPYYMTRESWYQPDYNPNLTRTWIVAGGAFLLLWTGLVAATGLAVGARRRKRDLGLLAANGADPSALRLAVISEGLVLGMLGSALGVAVGTIGAFLAEPWLLSTMSQVAAPRTSVPVLWLGILWSVGVLAAAVAAWSASVGIASLTPAQLLRGVRPTPRPAPAWFIAGAVLLVAGFVTMQVGRSMARAEGYGQVRTSWVVIGGSVLALTLGLIAVVVGGTRIAGRVTRSGPTSVRLAGRDLSRQGIRIAAAAAAVAMTLAGAMAIATWDQANRPSEMELAQNRQWLQGQSRSAYEGGAESVGQLSAEFSRLADGRVLPLVATAETVDAMASTGAAVAMLRQVDSIESIQHCTPVWEPSSDSQSESCSPTNVVIADAASSAMLPEEASSALTAGGLLVAGDPDTKLQSADGTRLSATWSPTALWVPNGGSYDLIPSGAVLVSEATAEVFGIEAAVPVAMTYVYVDMDGLDAAARRGVAERAESLGFRLSVGSWMPTYSVSEVSAAVYVGTAAGVGVLSLLIVMIALTLVRVESRSDDEVLLVSGASPGMSRLVSAARAGLIVLGAAVPATFVGWFVARILINGSAPTPWWALAATLLVLPAVAAALAWLVHRPPRRLTLT